MAHMAICTIAYFFTKSIDEPVRRRLTASEDKQSSKQSDYDDLAGQHGPPYFRIFDLPTELQLASFE